MDAPLGAGVVSISPIIMAPEEKATQADLLKAPFSPTALPCHLVSQPGTFWFALCNPGGGGIKLTQPPQT